MTATSTGWDRPAGRWLRVVAVGLGTSVVPLDTAVNIAFPDITGSFHLPLSMIQWVVICYVLTYAGLMLGCGRAGDIWGHGRVFRLGLVFGTAAFLLCAIAPLFGWLLFFRFLQGISAGLIISCAPALVTSLYPEERRSQAVGAFTMIFALSSALGPLLGGALVQRWGWPAVFWFRAPIALASLLLLRDLPAAVPREAREPLDILGAVLLALGLSSLLLAVNAAQHWDAGDHLSLPLAVVAAASLFGFARWEGRVARPIVRLDLFRLPGFALLNGANTLISLVNFSVLLFVPYFLTRFTSLPLSAAGAVLATGFASMAAASPLAGRIVARLPAGRVAPVGAVMIGGGQLLISFWHPDTTVSAMVSALVLQGLGLGLLQVAYMEIVMATLPPQHRGVAGSLSMLTRTIGVVSGATVLTLIFHSLDSAQIAARHGAAEAFLAAFAATFRIAGVTALAGGALLALADARRR